MNFFSPLVAPTASALIAVRLWAVTIAAAQPRPRPARRLVLQGVEVEVCGGACAPSRLAAASRVCVVPGTTRAPGGTNAATVPRSARNGSTRKADMVTGAEAGRGQSLYRKTSVFLQ